MRCPREMVSEWRLLFFLAIFYGGFSVINCSTNIGDLTALNSLKSVWKNVPPSWTRSNDPCGSPWEGVTCNNSRVIELRLSTMGIRGKLTGDIGSLAELRTLDLSFNKNITGPISGQVGNLQKLTILILAGCGLSGAIPDEIGNLSELTFLALNSNNFIGSIPPSLGKLSKLYWLDLAENQLTGSLPVSTNTSPGLDQLHNAKHFHFNKNQLSGSIPEKLFNNEMILIHILFDENQLTGPVPSTLGLVGHLEVLRLDRNKLSGEIPPIFSNFTGVTELNLAYNGFTGSIPDLTAMTVLNYLDLSNNSFVATDVPKWFSTLSSLTTLVMEYGSLQGTLPHELFLLPQLQQLILGNNRLSGTLDIAGNISPGLQLVDLQNNQISSLKQGPPGYTNTLNLTGNPFCTTDQNNNYCQPQMTSSRPYSTSLTRCGSKTCPVDRKLRPQSCECSVPYEGILYFRAPSFRELSNATIFQGLETSMSTNLDLTPGSVSLQNLFFNLNDYLQVQLQLFPASGEVYFNRSEIQRIGFQLSNQTYKPPKQFGPYYFIASPYAFPGNSKSSLSTGVIAGIAVACFVLVIALVVLGIYAVHQKKRAERAIEIHKPFASWGAGSGQDSGAAPQLKGARYFCFDDLKKCTNNFKESNEIGSGGYGKVYRGVLSDGQVVAIKRAQQGSLQGGLEFRTEIELLSRVHHKNLVGLIGFCFEQGEQMLVYEYMPNGTLREALSGKSGIYLDWKRRLRITLGSGRGLAYLHELANPPIIHRDVKSTNILLDENLTAKVADFGLSKLVSDSQKGHVSTQVKGTMGYLDPEYYMLQQLTDKSDVYSFGVVMLEMISARLPIEKGKYIVREVKMAMDMNDSEYCGLSALMDPSIKKSGHLVGFSRFLELALQCVEESADDRPTMNEAVKIIESILQNDGVGSNATSAASSATDFGMSKGAPRHPYNEGFPKDTGNSDSFDYSVGYAISNKIEPK
ncbi:hypothetical protein SAY87_014713 [Trapa incisa]|uniref:non-specific serine/threonine protein kinase n=1 Tax=Trapa incisa TaxID=236973 RepID=A0AAN7GWK3_9MYRT|nr:hypothetical protein SAY87_014713 [Trapa incisa]